jgi:Family of unknown function (DUF6206)
MLLSGEGTAVLLRLQEFEAGLNPARPEKSAIPMRIIGYGEISAIFEISSLPGLAVKRMPIFHERAGAEAYLKLYRRYCGYLQEAGLRLLEDDLYITSPAAAGRAWVLYIVQPLQPAENFLHNRIRLADAAEACRLTERVITETVKVWDFSEAHAPGLQLALDGQFSNWVECRGELFYVDTSTPLFRVDGTEQIDPEPLLASAPVFLRWILRLFFVDDVIRRYYDLSAVLTDLTANLYKEQRADLIEPVCAEINRLTQHRLPPLSPPAIRSYYAEDRLIWTLFLSFRRIDRGLRRLPFFKSYEFLLPGPVRR